MIIFDTNVVSEFLKSRPDQSALAWLKTIDPNDIRLAAMTVTELWFGVLAAEDEARKLQLSQKVRHLLGGLYFGKVLPFDLHAAEICARLMVEKKAFTPKSKIADLQIAATALSQNCHVATRDVADFQYEGLTVINPWEG